MNKTFKQTPEFKSDIKVILRKVDSKVHAQITASFDEIQDGSYDPEILLRLEIKNGKLGHLPVEKQSLIARENVNGINVLCIHFSLPFIYMAKVGAPRMGS